jgi:hypothetical protein
MPVMESTRVVDNALFEPVQVEGGELGEALQKLAAGTCATVGWPGLLTGDLADLVARIEQTDFEPYDEQRLDPPILKFGPAVYDFYTQGRVEDAYWEKSERTRQATLEIFGGIDPTAVVLARLQRELGIPVRPASIGGRPLHVGILREFTTGSKIHYDEVVREFPDRFDDRPVVQLAFNLHITVADRGGALTVWRHRWIPADDARRDGYGWAPEVVESAPRATVLAEAGEGVFFDCRNFHQVQDFEGGRRITLSFFAGITMSGEMIVWS